MAYPELQESIRSGAEIEKRNQDLLMIGKQAGEAIVTILPLIKLVTQNWGSQFPLNPNVDATLQKTIQDLGAYCDFFYPPGQFGANRNDLSHLTNVVSLNLNPTWQGEFHDDPAHPNRLRMFLQQYFDLLTLTFTLPEMNDDDVEYLLNAPLEKRMEWVGAPAGLEGLRFLPSYRRLTWGKDDEKAGEQCLIYKPGVPLDIIQFEKKGGREFFLCSTGGIIRLDKLLENTSRYEPIYVVGAKKDSSPLQVEASAVVVDKDSTISYENWWANDKDNVQIARAVFFKELTQKGIPTLIWSRNESVSSFQEDLEKFLGIKLLPPLTFDNWPFLNPDSNQLEFDPNYLRSCIDSIPPDLYETFAQYVQENFDEEAGHPFSYYAEVLRKKIEAFMTGHFLIWRSNEFRPIDVRAQSGLACENLLEAKVPMFVGLSQNALPLDVRANYVHNGILVNDREFSIESMKVFGYSFIHVDWVPHVDRAADIIGLSR